jgi:biopolymer transport protein ExbD
MKFPRNARIFRGQLDASPFVGVLFLVAIFLLLNSSLVFVPGVAIKLPEAADLPGVIGPTVTVAVDSSRHFYFRNQIIKESDLQVELRKAALETKEPLTLMLLADKTVSVGTMVQLAGLARAAGLKEAIFVTRPPAAPARPKAVR